MKKVILISLVTVLIIVACKTTVTNKNELNITFTSKSDSNVIGTANFTEKNGEVTLIAKMSGLSPGEHAIHIHEKSDCSAADGSSAGGHWNPTFKKHGKWGDTEHHKGDIGNFTADANGNGTVKFSTSEWCIGCEDETKNILGKGLIVHKGTDDFTSQPAGNAGARQACSAIIK
jgi:superoxide dismutase, Cu-Zn family